MAFIPSGCILQEVAQFSCEGMKVFLLFLAASQEGGVDVVLTKEELEGECGPVRAKKGVRECAENKVVIDRKEGLYQLHPRLWAASDMEVGLPADVGKSNRGREVYKLARLWKEKVGVGSEGHAMKVVSALSKEYTLEQVRKSILEVAERKAELDIKSPQFLKYYVESGGAWGPEREQPTAMRIL